MQCNRLKKKKIGSLKLFGNCSHGGPTGSMMLYHVLMRPLVASASSIAFVFIIDVCDAGAATQSYVFGAYHRQWLGGQHEAFAAALKDM